MRKMNEGGKTFANATETAGEVNENKPMKITP